MSTTCCVIVCRRSCSVLPSWNSSMGHRCQAIITPLLLAIAYYSTTVSAARNAPHIQRSLLARSLAGTVPVLSEIVNTSLIDSANLPANIVLSGESLWASTAYKFPGQLGGFKPSAPGVWGQVHIRKYLIPMVVTIQPPR